MSSFLNDLSSDTHTFTISKSGYHTEKKDVAVSSNTSLFFTLKTSSEYVHEQYLIQQQQTAEMINYGIAGLIIVVIIGALIGVYQCVVRKKCRPFRKLSGKGQASVPKILVLSIALITLVVAFSGCIDISGNSAQDEYEFFYDKLNIELNRPFCNSRRH